MSRKTGQYPNHATIPQAKTDTEKDILHLCMSTIYILRNAHADN